LYFRETKSERVLKRGQDSSAIRLLDDNKGEVLFAAQYVCVACACPACSVPARSVDNSNETWTTEKLTLACRVNEEINSRCGPGWQRRDVSTAAENEAIAHLQQEGTNTSLERLVELPLAHVHLQHHHQGSHLLE